MSSKRRRGGPYFTDNRILPRVRDYLKQNPSKQKYPQPEDVVEWLKHNFAEYGRTSNNALRSTVEKALAVIETQRRETPENMYDSRKKSNRSDFYEDDDDGEDNNSYNDSSDSLEMDSNIQLVEVQDTNAMNAKLISTYQRAANPGTPSTPKNDSNMNNTANNNTPSSAPDFIPLRSSQSNSKPANSNQNVFANSAYNPLGSSANNVNKQQSGSNGPSNQLQQLSGNVRSAPSPSPSKATPKNKRRKIDNNTYQNSSNIDDLDAQIEGAITSKISSKNRPNLRYSDLGGMEHVLQDVRELIERPLTHPEIYSHLGAEPPRGILLHGPPGCGKTMLAHAIAGELGVPFFMIAAPEIVSGMSGESEAKIRGLFNDAAAKAPSIIFIDEIDAITSKREQSGKAMEARIVAQLLTCIDQIGNYSPGNMAGDPMNEDGVINNVGNIDGLITVKSKPVIIIGATNRPDSLDSALRRAGRFDREISLNVPDEASRARILQVLAKKLKLEGNFDFVHIAKKTPGFVGADLTALTKEAASICINRVFSQLEATEVNPNSMEVDTPEKTKTNGSDQIQPFVSAQQKMRLESERELGQRSMASDVLRARIEPFTEDQLRPLAITMNDFELAIKKVQPSAKREGFATIPNVTWSDVGALDKIRKELEMAILEPIRSREKFEAVGLTQPCGVLLFGPPGCGKTLLAKAVANECQANFISVKGPELLNKYVGESERAIRQLFQRANASSPCIIFFDELDAIVPRRQGGENQVTERVVNQLLTELDGLEQRKQIFIVAATNRPDMIDSAMLRPGRLDKLLYVPLPSPEERVDILKTCLRHTPIDSSVDIARFATSDKCNGFSGADIASLVREAATEALRENIENKDPTNPTVKGAHFEVALTKVFPSVSRQDEIRYNSMRTQMVSSRLREVPGEEKAEKKKTEKK
jgi:ribosome biogenesis ATPase